MSFWVFWRFPETLRLQPCNRDQIPEAYLWPHAGPHRYPHRGPARGLRKAEHDRLGESSASIRERVQAARDRQRVRFEGSDIVCNSDMRVAEVRQFCKLDEAGDNLVRQTISQLNLSARGYHRVLKLARTIADLAGSEDIQYVHLAKALQYRPKLMMGQ
jgi:magnesium chelatase family protein